MRLATWNVNGLRSRMEFVLHWLRTRQPDVVGMQELKLTDEQFPHDLFAPLGYRALTHGQKAWNGVAILAREEARVVQAGLTGHEEMGARLLSAEVAGVVFTTVYVPNGKSVGHEDFPRKLAWLDALAAHFATRDSRARRTSVRRLQPLPHTARLVERAALHGHIFHTDESARAGSASPRSASPTCSARSIPTRRRSRGGTIATARSTAATACASTSLLGSAPLLPRVTAVEIDREYRKKQDGFTASDHAPVWVDLA